MSGYGIWIVGLATEGLIDLIRTVNFLDPLRTDYPMSCQIF